MAILTAYKKLKGDNAPFNVETFMTALNLLKHA